VSLCFRIALPDSTTKITQSARRVKLVGMHPNHLQGAASGAAQELTPTMRRDRQHAHRATLGTIRSEALRNALLVQWAHSAHQARRRAHCGE
jgi:hypothetical protein